MGVTFILGLGKEVCSAGELSDSAWLLQQGPALRRAAVTQCCSLPDAKAFRGVHAVARQCLPFK